ncbi:MAG: citrate synthase [Bacteriovoracaceae bacterium]|jgi:citrate synthase|nr:citrate synthase [Bacteriovoracaceae bacterium]
MSKSAKIIYGDKEVECPVVEGTEGEVGIDISKLRSSSGLITLDNGFANTSSGTSAITFLDGEKGILRYRGISIEDLAKNSSFIEVAYLLIYGNLPTEQELLSWESEIKHHTLIKEDLSKLFDAFPRDAHPMGVLSSAISAMSTFYQEYLDPKNSHDVDQVIIKLLGMLPTIASYSYKTSINQPRVYPRNDLDYCSNFLNMMFSVPSEKYEVPSEVVEALNLLLILHADHEQNCSTSAVRLIGSSEANLFASISGGISALWGPLHGGANQAVMEMLNQIHLDGGNVQKFIDLAKDKNSSFRLMGFGHRVYKNFDPRAKIIKGACDKVLEKMGVDNPLLNIAKELEHSALNDQYFVDRKLYPNVDFYSGIIYSAINIPVNMFTVMFALGRLPGWIAHWKEMNEDPKSRIGRPRQIYNGENEYSYVDLNKRLNKKKAA